MRWILQAIAATLVLALSGASAQAPRREALVIANSAYTVGGTLPTASNDSRIVAEALRRTGFSVEVRSNLDVYSFRAVLGRFTARSRGAQVSLVYYAGHGLSIGDENWLVPIDAQLASKRDLEREAINLKRVLESLSGASVKVVLLDASRANVFGRAWTEPSRGIQRLESTENEPNTIVMFSGASNASASDAILPFSPFATALARRLPEPAVDAKLLFQQVADDVHRQTRGAQTPLIASSLGGEEIVFAQGRRSSVAAGAGLSSPLPQGSTNATSEASAETKSLPSSDASKAVEPLRASIERIESEVARLEKLRFNKPERMRINRPHVVEAQIGMRMLQTLGDVGPTVTRNVEVPKAGGVRVELISDQLRIEKLHKVDTVFLEPGKSGLWSWQVTPYQEGKQQRMLLQVYVTPPGDGTGEALVETYRETVAVDVTPLDRMELYGRAFLKRWEIVAGVSGAIAALWGLVVFLMRRRRSAT